VKEPESSDTPTRARASGDTFSTNTANSNAYYGCYLVNSDGNTLTGNTVDSNNQYGYYDTTTVSGTRGTANFCTSDICKGNGVTGSSPSGHGSSQSWNVHASALQLICPTPSKSLTLIQSRKSKDEIAAYLFLMCFNTIKRVLDKR
jgi:parallel beta-helix repeat protein